MKLCFDIYHLTYLVRKPYTMSQTISTAEVILKAALSASRLARELSDSCPPARAAASVLLLIFETIEVR